MVVQHDGAIVIVGRHQSYFFAGRLEPNGELDDGFGDGGWVRHPFERNVAFQRPTDATDIVLLPTGEFVVLCTVDGGAIGMLQLEADGEVDLDYFGDGVGDGWTFMTVPTAYGGTAVDIRLQAPARLIVTVNTTDGENAFVDESVSIYGFHAQ
jgi:hypothetical protein